LQTSKILESQTFNLQLHTSSRILKS
jgi:hypothetical protein